MKKYYWLLLITLGFALSLSACGGAAPTPAPAVENKAAASAEGSDAPAGGLASELSVYNWADYIDEELLKNYEKEYGVKIIYDTFASNEDLLAKLQAGATGYDVIVPSDYMVGQMIDLGLLAEIDHNNIPNLKNIDPFFLNAPYDPGNKHCVPYQWGTTGLAYSTKLFGDNPPDSWSFLFDPEQAKKWADAGGINVLNDQRELLGSALKYLGYSLNTHDEKQLEEAKNAIVAIKPYIKTFNSEDYDDSLLIPGEVVISQAWSGDGFKAVFETMDEATGKSEWGYVIPKEGAMVWQDNLCVTAASQKKATAEHFMNYLLDAKNSAAITNFTYYASPNKAAREFINKDILEDPGIYPAEETMAKLEWAEKLGETLFVYDRLWTEIKSQ
jgi:spermidine/putrescine transport system substrate-binding protein